MKKLLVLVTFVLLVSLSASAQTQQPIRVNCGGPAYTDSKGQTWSADYGFNSGTNTNVSNNPIAGTADPMLFQSERYGATILYNFSVPNGSYHVNLRLSEIYWTGSGKRIMNVKLQGATVASNLDIFALVGGNTAFVEGFDTTVSTGMVTLELDAVANNAKCSAIEIFPTTAPAAVGTLGVNPGSSALFDDGKPIMPSSTASVTELENGTWTTVGTVTSDAAGLLTGSLKVDPSFVSNGNVWLSLNMLGIPAPGSQGIDPRMLQQGSTGVTLKVVIFKAVLLPKSVSLALTP
jgi:hypothetical protein